LRSRLSEIPGIGPAREQALLRSFGSVEALLAASVKELEATPGVGRSTAARIHASLTSGEGA
jgi:excinuclease ABC subunit C